MKYIKYVLKRYFLTFVCKVAAKLASKIKTNWTMCFLDNALKERDKTLCREAKYCMQKTVEWQQKAQKCIAAHAEYDKAIKKK